MTQGNAPLVEEFQIGHPSLEWARAASEVGAAIVHQLNEPLTALLLYVGDLRENSARFPADDCAGQSLRQVAENAYREAERLCLLLEKIGEFSNVPLPKESAIRRGRDVIRWWSQSGGRNGGDAPAVSGAREPLTARESEVLHLVIEGCSNKEGGVRMRISYRTFESHRAEVMRKFRAKNAADLIRLSQLAPEQPRGGRIGSAIRA
jgi:DNA-binding CsgD family transcriptional regulator